MGLQPFASPDAIDLIFSPQHHGRPAADIDDRRDWRSGVELAPRGTATRTIADHAHHRRADGFQTYRATCARDRSHRVVPSRRPVRSPSNRNYHTVITVS